MKTMMKIIQMEMKTIVIQILQKIMMIIIIKRKIIIIIFHMKNLFSTRVQYALVFVLFLYLFQVLLNVQQTMILLLNIIFAIIVLQFQESNHFLIVKK